MSIVIEKAKTTDAEDILNFTKIIGSETDNLSFGEGGIPISVDQESSYLKSIENSNKEIFLIAKDENEIVGTANYSCFSKKRMAHRGEFGIAVKKSYWNQGIGTMLLEQILDFAKNVAKSEIVSLEVRSDNKSAIRLYEKFGFKKIGTFKGYFKINESLVDFDIFELFL